MKKNHFNYLILRKIVNMIVQSMNSNAFPMAVASWMHGSVMVTRIVPTVQTKMMLFVVSGDLQLNLHQPSNRSFFT